MEAHWESRQEGPTATLTRPHCHCQPRPGRTWQGDEADLSTAGSPISLLCTPDATQLPVPRCLEASRTDCDSHSPHTDQRLQHLHQGLSPSLPPGPPVLPRLLRSHPSPAQGSRPPAAATRGSQGPVEAVVVVPTARLPRSTLSSGKFPSIHIPQEPHIWSAICFYIFLSKVWVCAVGLSYTRDPAALSC